jgi:hypothetical protein
MSSNSRTIELTPAQIVTIGDLFCDEGVFSLDCLPFCSLCGVPGGCREAALGSAAEPVIESSTQPKLI